MAAEDADASGNDERPSGFISVSLRGGVTVTISLWQREGDEEWTPLPTAGGPAVPIEPPGGPMVRLVLGKSGDDAGAAQAFLIDPE